MSSKKYSSSTKSKQTDEKQGIAELNLAMQALQVLLKHALG